MHQTGLAVSDALKNEINACEENSSIFFVKLQINAEDFVKKAEGNDAGSLEANIEAVKAVLDDREPSYVLMRSEQGNKWTVCFYVPDNATVKNKMTYAASGSALKSGIGGSKFTDDWAISSQAECSAEEYQTHLGNKSNTDAVKSGVERMNEETAYEELKMERRGSKTRAIVGIPIKMADEVTAAITAVASGASSHVELTLDVKTEILSSSAPDDAGLTGLNFPEKEPRYHIVNYKHNHDGEDRSKIIFIYYCPMKAQPQQKMFYSTAKTHMVQLLNQLEVKDFLNVECDSAAEVTEELMLTEIYPPVAKSTAFKKPAARGRGRQNLGKFKA